MKKLNRVIIAALAFGPAAVSAGEIGHFAPGVLNIRDYAVPEPGLINDNLKHYKP